MPTKTLETGESCRILAVASLSCRLPYPCSVFSSNPDNPGCRSDVHILTLPRARLQPWESQTCRYGMGSFRYLRSWLFLSDIYIFYSTLTMIIQDLWFISIYQNYTTLKELFIVMRRQDLSEPPWVVESLVRTENASSPSKNHRWGWLTLFRDGTML